MSPEGFKITLVGGRSEMSPLGTSKIYPAFCEKDANILASNLNQALVERGITNQHWVPVSLGDVPYVSETPDT